jgi:hypothetical protein
MGQWSYVTKRTQGHLRSVIIEDKIGILLCQIPVPACTPYVFSSEVKFCRDVIQLSTKLTINYSSSRQSISATQSAKISITGSQTFSFNNPISRIEKGLTVSSSFMRACPLISQKRKMKKEECKFIPRNQQDLRGHRRQGRKINKVNRPKN